jgi:hypothetical protein
VDKQSSLYVMGKKSFIRFSLGRWMQKKRNIILNNCSISFAHEMLKSRNGAQTFDLKTFVLIAIGLLIFDVILSSKENT